MRITYNRDEDILMLCLDPRGEIDHAEQTNSVIVHLTRSGQPVLLEILDASEFLTRGIRVTMRAEETVG